MCQKATYIGEVFGTLSCIQDNLSNQHLCLQLRHLDTNSFWLFSLHWFGLAPKGIHGTDASDLNEAAAKNISQPHLECIRLSGILARVTLLALFLALVWFGPVNGLTDS